MNQVLLVLAGGGGVSHSKIKVSCSSMPDWQHLFVCWLVNLQEYFFYVLSITSSSSTCNGRFANAFNTSLV